MSARLLRLLTGLALALLAWAAPAAAHHVGYYTPRDNDLSANYKQIKFALQARKWDVAHELYARGAVRRELRARSAELPPRLDAAIGEALRTGAWQEAERGLMLFFVAVIRDLALEADRRLEAAGGGVEARAEAARRLLAAIWRYYNLVDFVVTRHAPEAGAGVRLAFDAAEAHVKEESPAPEPDRVREPLQQIARILTGVLEAATPSARRDS